MTNACSICNNTNRVQIHRDMAEGKSSAYIARNYDVSYHAVNWCRKNHLSRQLVQSVNKKVLVEDLNLLERIDKLISRAERIFQRNYKQGKDLLALKAISSQRATFELLAKISYALHEQQKAEELANQSTNAAEEEESFNDKISILTTPELEMLSRIHDKLERQDKDYIIIPETVSEYLWTPDEGEEVEEYKPVRKRKRQGM